MLVSIALVLIMMLMFAQVFEIAAGIHSKVRGLSRNDQRVRILTIRIRGDLDKRSMQNVTPFRFNEHVWTFDRDLDNRQGYFSVSENQPANDRDDVLQFTLLATRTQRNTDSVPYFGRSTQLGTSANQPDYDDGLLGNGASQSIAAEVSYFLRSGTLYRRVMLLRQPGIGGPQPTTGDGSELLANYTGRFWSDFDLSAHYDLAVGLRIHGVNSLDNSGSTTGYPLGIRKFRFGHSHRTGLAREYVTGGGFFGRYTHEETSSPAFGYPRTVTNSGRSPMDTDYPTSLNAEGVVNECAAGGTRRAEDVLMTNVHSFDVKISRGGDPLDENFDTYHSADSQLPLSTQPPEWSTTTAYSAGTIVRSRNRQRFGLAYRCRVNGSTGTHEPNWPRRIGRIVIDAQTRWETIADPRRAVAIQITIRFHDLKSDQLRQLTIVHPLVD